MNDIIVNTRELAKLNEEFLNLIQKYVNNKVNFFYLMNNLEQFWRGTDEEKFAEIIRQEERNMDLFIEKIKKIYNYCVATADGYNDILRKIEEYENSYIK